MPFTVNAGHAGRYEFRMIADWGKGGVTRLAGSVTPHMGDIWGYVYFQEELSEGAQTLEMLGFEGCCDGVATLEVMLPDACDLDPTGLIYAAPGSAMSLGPAHVVWGGLQPSTGGWVLVDSAADFSCAKQSCGPPAPEVTCANAEANGLETGVDCGGAACGSLGLFCPPGGGCKVAADCASGLVCSATQVCSSCTNGAKDGDETGVDCGGTCDKCGTGEGCFGGDDCAEDLICFTQGEDGAAVSKGADYSWQTIADYAGSARVGAELRAECLSFPDLSPSFVFRMTTGGERGAVDYFRPARAMTACEFALSSRNHLWSAEHNGTYVAPAYFAGDGRYGGSAKGFPADGHDHLPFWGGGGPDLGAGVPWGMPLRIELARTGACGTASTLGLSASVVP